MYSGGFYAYPTPEEHWAYWSRYIQVNRYEDAPRPVYDSLYRLISEKDYFVLTTNVDHCFQKAGFDKKRLFYTQGDYGLLQCCEPCHRQTYDNRALILRMVEEQKNMRIPTALIPRCPKCGKPMKRVPEVIDCWPAGMRIFCAATMACTFSFGRSASDTTPRASSNILFGR